MYLGTGNGQSIELKGILCSIINDKLTKEQQYLDLDARYDGNGLV